MNGARAEAAEVMLERLNGEIEKTSKGQNVHHARNNEHDAAIALTDFLLVRIAEDEASLPEGFDCWYSLGRYAAECEAKRRIVELHTPLDGEECDPSCGDIMSPCRTIAALALPYADHPDYREEWKP